MKDVLQDLMLAFVGFRYGGGPTLARKVINSGLSQTELSVEVYPLRLKLHLNHKGEQSAIRISKKVLRRREFTELLCCFLPHVCILKK